MCTQSQMAIKYCVALLVPHEEESIIIGTPPVPLNPHPLPHWTPARIHSLRPPPRRPPHWTRLAPPSASLSSAALVPHCGSGTHRRSVVAPAQAVRDDRFRVHGSEFLTDVSGFPISHRCMLMKGIDPRRHQLLHIETMSRRYR